MKNSGVISIDFPPNIKVRWGHGSPPHSRIAGLLAEKLGVQVDFLKKCAAHYKEFESIQRAKENDTDPYWGQNWFPPLDGISLYTLIADARPARYMEIGSGNSTKFARYAISKKSPHTKITSIDPSPRAEIDLISDMIYRVGVEDVGVQVFDELDANDVLFFDGSHRSFQNSDVTVFFLEILPRLRKGVFVGVHDIFLPNDYPPAWVGRYYNEQYMLATYILAKETLFDLVFACNYMSNYQLAHINATFSDTLKMKIKDAGKRVSGGAMWFRV